MPRTQTVQNWDPLSHNQGQYQAYLSSKMFRQNIFDNLGKCEAKYEKTKHLTNLN